MYLYKLEGLLDNKVWSRYKEAKYTGIIFK